MSEDISSLSHNMCICGGQVQLEMKAKYLWTFWKTVSTEIKKYPPKHIEPSFLYIFNPIWALNITLESRGLIYKIQQKTTLKLHTKIFLDLKTFFSVNKF